MVNDSIALQKAEDLGMEVTGQYLLHFSTGGHIGSAILNPFIEKTFDSDPDNRA